MSIHFLAWKETRTQERKVLVFVSFSSFHPVSRPWFVLSLVLATTRSVVLFLYAKASTTSSPSPSSSLSFCKYNAQFEEKEKEGDLSEKRPEQWKRDHHAKMDLPVHDKTPQPANQRL